MDLAVVTGASSGIGAAVARALAESGRPLLLLARRRDRLDALDLASAMTASVDVTDADAVGRAVEAAVSAHGPVGTLVNCAGVLHLAPFLTQTVEEWSDTLNVNVLGTVIPIRAVLPGMLERGTGTIVNVSSVAGRHGFVDHAAYCASKFAVEGLSASLRREVGPRGVRVIVIAPGVVDTDLGAGSHGGRFSERKAKLARALDGGLHPDAVAAVVRHAVDAPPSETAQEIVVTHVREA
ncbi:MAG TPA: SDR family NAD(P)-dependent oxidoreductase [Acidimicrobiales bacterium]|nr:SDR family NAD(P)-dependent oxidoreductase [Acidimicrobiales bacterium]